MDGAWLTYEQAAERLNTSPEAIRQRAIRHRWPRTAGNDGKARVRMPDGIGTASGRPNKRPVRTVSGQVDDALLIKSLEAHVETLKEQLAVAQDRAEKLAVEIANRDAKHAADLAAEREKVEAERAKADKAIAEFGALADALTKIAAERARPWWRRWVG